MTRNAAPARRRIHTGGITREIASPASTAIAEDRVSASAEPRNTSSLAGRPPESERAASCVLSPSSATKMATKVLPRTAQFIEASQRLRWLADDDLRPGAAAQLGDVAGLVGGDDGAFSVGRGADLDAAHVQGAIGRIAVRPRVGEVAPHVRHDRVDGHSR